MTVTPTLNGYVAKAATVQVVDPTLTVKINPGTVVETASANRHKGPFT